MFKCVVIVASLFFVGCATTGSSERALPHLNAAPTDASDARASDCERRLEGMLETEKAMRTGPNPNFQGWAPKNIGMGSDNPCRREQNRLGGVDEDVKAKERRDREFAKVRARSMLTSGRPLDAWGALRGAFSLHTPPDPEILALARSTGADVLRAVAARKSPGVDASGKRTCSFAQAPIQADLKGNALVLEGVRTVHVWCALDPAAAVGRPERTIRLRLRKRLDFGSYAMVDELDLGRVEAYRIQGAVQGRLEIPIFKGSRRVYYDVELRFSDAPEQAGSLARGGFMWFPSPEE